MSSVHSVEGVGDALAGGYIDGGGAVEAATVGEGGGFIGVAGVS